MANQPSILHCRTSNLILVLSAVFLIEFIQIGDIAAIVFFSFSFHRCHGGCVLKTIIDDNTKIM